jgi:hypothetical protein
MKIKVIFTLLILFFTASAGYTDATNSGKTNASSSASSPYLSQFYSSASAPESNNFTNQPSPLWTFIKSIAFIMIFAAAAYLLIRYLAKKGGLPATADEKLVETVMTKFIGMGSYLQIVKVGATYYLLSLSTDGARLIDRITDKETIDFIELNKDDMKPKQTKFFDILTFFPKGKSLDKIDFLKNQKDRLKKL